MAGDDGGARDGPADAVPEQVCRTCISWPGVATARGYPGLRSPDRTQSCRDCIDRGSVTARDGGCVATGAWSARHGAGTRQRHFHEPSRSQIPRCIPYRNEALLGSGPGVAGAALGNPGLGYAIPSGMVRPGGWGAQDRRGSCSRLENSSSSPHQEAICVPASHTSGGVAIRFISTCRSQSLFVSVTKHDPGSGTPFLCLNTAGVRFTQGFASRRDCGTGLVCQFPQRIRQVVFGPHFIPTARFKPSPSGMIRTLTPPTQDSRCTANSGL